MNRSSTLLAAIIAASALLAHPFDVAAESDASTRTSNRDSYGVLAAKWWRWALATDAPSAPSGLVDCRDGQRGPIWFLAGAFETDRVRRTCDRPIPGRKRLFFPLINVEVTAADCVLAGLLSAQRCSVAEKRELADGLFNDLATAGLEEAFFGVGSVACRLNVTVDGMPTQFASVPIVRVQSPPFHLRGDREAIADGYWVLLPRLFAGAREVSFSGAVCNENDITEVLFEPAVTYSLTVVR